jgi:hypothetical protein
MGCYREGTPDGGVMFWCGSGIKSGSGGLTPEEREILRLRRRLAHVLALTQDSGLKFRRGPKGLVWSWKRTATRGRVWSRGASRSGEGTR